ncbi:MAG: divalent-cation tolerance protein CutA [Hydrogenophilales bacterium 16-64-46]|nr:MAG: divalent-cation tolerance protein CutA [Hydrogenophilales bacterium 12-64-13]OYZ05302.1 MAG: divalent-cation tolerance protein CutA [Hydrogenophilales bacterium 16-64-46]OZA37116.1 MAG: divalent-cation tolerance protein CutA [Hydrogenophilales bacterium 17-64-34]HQS99402.1 divalent-cation tolerance protein CutA [Thiobacillus sp.]
MEPLLVLTNVPDRALAEKLAHALVEARVAACVNVLAPCRSIYRWQDAVESAEESPLMIKTTVTHYTAVEKLIRDHHPYAVPEVIAIPITQGLPAYLDWLTQETESPGD